MPKVNSLDSRRKARMLALQSLFAIDVRGSPDEFSIEWLNAESPLSAKGMAFSQQLLHGSWDNHHSLDEVIQRYAPAWPVKQLSIIDRNILRIALFELMYCVDIPRKTAVNEAVELAKAFGSESSARFVNGVLGSVLSGLNLGELTPHQPVPEGR